MALRPSLVFRALMLLVLAGVAFSPLGCKGLNLQAFGGAKQKVESASEEDSDKPSESSPADEQPDTSAALAKLPPAVMLDAWIALAPQPSLEPDAGYYWRHAGLESLLAAPADEHPDFAAVLDSENGVAATNAAIALARLGDQHGRDRLVESVRDTSLRLELRCAAAEALGGLSAPPEVKTLRELIDRYGRFGGDAPTYLPELHAELLYALGRQVDAGTDERFTAALKSPAAIVRLAAVRGWVRAGQSELPQRVADLRTDPDTRVRAATLDAMVSRRHPQAFDTARAALHDYRLEVRLTAIAALGRLGGDEARQALEALQREPEAIWAPAVAALGALDARDSVFAAADNPSWRVRQSVARALARWPDDESAELIRRLMTDPSIEVQKQIVVALADWPLPQAGPLLLEVIERGGYLPGKLAAAQLAEQWRPAEDYSADAPADRRAEILATLSRAWHEQYGSVGARPPAAGSAAAPDAPDGQRVDAAAELIAMLHTKPTDGPAATQALRGLREFGPDLPVVLAQLITERQTALPERVYREVLPHFGEQFSELDRLVSADVQQRRRAASRLADGARRSPLALLAMIRLADLGAREPDALVWISMLRAVADDEREPSISLAYAGLGHSSPEVRRLAIEHLAAHPAPAHARPLLPALEDKHQAVVLAAVKALGHPGMLDDPAPLERLLATNDPKLRLAVTQSLILLRAERGPQTLELLAHDSNADTRRQAALMMGRFAEPRYTATLIGLLDDTLGVRLAALAALPRVAGHDLAEAASDTSTLDRIGRWKQWWEHRGDAVDGGGEPQAASLSDAVRDALE